VLAKITHLLKLSIFVVIGTSALLLFAESFFYPGFSEKYFHVQPKLIAAWALLWTVILRIVSKNSIKLSQELPFA
jgi:hypothetical protein